MIYKNKFNKILNPKSIAIFGGTRAAHVVRECKKLGYTGELWPIHPHKSEIGGVKTFPSLMHLPDIPDCAYIAVNADSTIEIVGQLSELGCGGAILHASGFSEIGGDGEERQKQLLEKAGNMPIVGPNCYGVLNCLDKVALWPDQHGGSALETGVAIITQSGNIAINMTMQKRGVPLAYMFTLGNQAQFSISDAIEAVLADDRITAIGLHIEAIDDLKKFEKAAHHAFKKKCPIVAMKTGKTETASAIAKSHTSSLSGSDKLFNNFFDHLGIGRVDTVPELLESLKLLHVLGPLEGNRLSSMSCSGGEAGMLADLAENYAVTFPAIDSGNGQSLKETLGDYISLSNPFDYHTYIWGDEEAKTKTFSEMMKIGFDANLLLLDWPNYEGADLSEWDAAMNAMIKASEMTGQKAVIISSLPECMPEYVFETAMAANVAPMLELDTALKALEVAAKIGERFSLPVIEKIGFSNAETAGAELWDEWKSKKILQSYGVTIPESSLVTSETEAISAAEALGFPVVVKAVSNNLMHKTEVGAVLVNLKTPDEVEQAAGKLLMISGKLLVEKMVADPVAEIIVGVSRDPQFGLSMVIGSGGVLVEILKDSEILLFPVREEAVNQAIRKLKIYPILQGYRGQQGADLSALSSTILKIAHFVESHGETIEEMDINPLMVCKVDQGVYAVDAAIKMIK